MPPRLPVSENSEASALSQGPGFGRVAAVVGVVLALLVVLRIYLWNTPPLTAGSYDRPIGQRHLVLRPGDREFPENWTLEEDGRTLDSLTGVSGLAAGLELPEVPARDRVEQVLVAGYRDPAGDPAWIVAVRYRGEDAPAQARAAVRQDHHLAWALREGGATSGTLGEAMESKARRIKQVRVWAEKMKTLGSAYVQFGLDVVGALLLGCLLLFLTKYFLIMRQIEE